MVKSNTTIMIVGILVGLIFAGLPCLEAQSPMYAPVMSPGTPIVMSPDSPTAMAPGPDCLTLLYNVSDCLGYVQIGSNLTVPDKNCCPEFAGLLDSNPICLCELIGQAKDYSIDINRAYKLPSVCKVTAPPPSACPGSPNSAPAPGTASELAPGSTPAPGTASEFAPGSTAAGPGADRAALSPSESGMSGASSIAVQDLSRIICLAVAIFVAYYF